MSPLSTWLHCISAQGGPARLVALSGGTSNHSFLFGHGGIGGGCEPFDAEPRLSARVRTSNRTDARGCPGLTTDDHLSTDWVHAVFTANMAGRAVYVDGAMKASDTAGAGDFGNWSTDDELVLGNESSLDRQWLGTFELVAIYDRVLDDAEIGQNFDMGRDGT